MRVTPIILLLVAILSAVSDARDRNQGKDTSLECFVSFLKEKNIENEFFNDVRVMNPLTEACLNGVEEEKAQLFEEIKSNLRYLENHECLIEKLDNEEYKNLLLENAVIKMKNEGVMRKLGKFWSGKKTPKQKAVEKVTKQLQDYVGDKKLFCNLKIGFEDVFDSFFEIEYEEENLVPYEDVEDFCIKKELTEKEVVDQAKYHFKMYPKNIRVDSLDCTKILDPIKKNLISSLNDFQSENTKKRKNRCAFNILKDGDDYFHLMLKMELFSKISLTREQKQQEKIDFVSKMIEISKKIDDRCIKA